MLLRRVLGCLALVAWTVAIVSSAIYEHGQYDVPNWGLGYLMLSSSFAAFGLSIALWGVWAGAHENRVRKSVLFMLTVTTTIMISVALVVG
jgi:hypothetical protein